MCAVPNMAVFCSSLTLWFPGMSLTYYLNDLEMVPVAPILLLLLLLLESQQKEEDSEIIGGMGFSVFNLPLICFLVWF